MKHNLTKTQFTYLETIVFKHLASINNKHSNELNAQINNASVSARENSSAGFITYLKVPNGIPALKTFSVHKVIECYAQHPDNPAGAGFSLWLKHGILYALEGYVFIDRWPINEFKFKILTTYESLCGELVNSNYTENNSNALI